jgi:hypothetical protein
MDWEDRDQPDRHLAARSKVLTTVLAKHDAVEPNDLRACNFSSSGGFTRLHGQASPADRVSAFDDSDFGLNQMSVADSTFATPQADRLNGGRSIIGGALCLGKGLVGRRRSSVASDFDN